MAGPCAFAGIGAPPGGAGAGSASRRQPTADPERAPAIERAGGAPSTAEVGYTATGSCAAVTPARRLGFDQGVPSQTTAGPQAGANQVRVAAGGQRQCARHRQLELNHKARCREHDQEPPGRAHLWKGPPVGAVPVSDGSFSPVREGGAPATLDGVLVWRAGSPATGGAQTIKSAKCRSIHASHTP
jgi:hypothetical protein